MFGQMLVNKTNENYVKQNLHKGLQKRMKKLHNDMNRKHGEPTETEEEWEELNKPSIFRHNVKEESKRTRAISKDFMKKIKM